MAHVVKFCDLSLLAFESLIGEDAGPFLYALTKFCHRDRIVQRTCGDIGHMQRHLAYVRTPA